MPTGIKFAYKIILLMVGCIAFTGTVIAVLFAINFRHDLLQQERSSSYTVYQATVNYLTGHFFSKRENFVPRSLDYVFSNKFLVVENDADFAVTHRPERLMIYDPNGRLIYAFDRTGAHPAPVERDPALAPREVEITINMATDHILVDGPIDSGGVVPGQVVLYLPSNIRARLMSLYIKCAVILLGGTVITTLLGAYFSRRFLAPVVALTDAARRVQAGDYACRIDNTSNDEIGLLTATFNEMVNSWARRLNLMHRIQEWTLKVGNEFDRHRLYARLLDMFHNVAASRQCALYLRDGDKKVTPPVAVRGEQELRPELAQWVRFVLDKREPLLAERKITAPAGSFGHVEHMVLPLMSGDQAIGAVYLGPPLEAAAYDNEMVATLQTLAQHAGIAVENARLLNEVAEKKRIEQEMSWARDIQKTLLPHSPPVIAGYGLAGLSLPANEVGGDYFDYITHDDHLCHLIVSDVSGKGVAAGLIMSVLRSLVHTYTEFETSPHNILMRVNRVLTRDLDEFMFVTATMIALNPQAHELRIARAGHEPVLIIDRQGLVRWIRPSGTALGLLDVDSFESHFESSTYIMQPGDMVLLYTDGVNEAQNESGEEYGIDRLVRLACANRTLELKELLDTIVRDVNAFAGNRHQQDDLTLVVLRRDEARPPL